MRRPGNITRTEEDSHKTPLCRKTGDGEFELGKHWGGGGKRECETWIHMSSST
jgi:hypothetical protein